MVRMTRVTGLGMSICSTAMGHTVTLPVVRAAIIGSSPVQRENTPEILHSRGRAE